MLKDQNKIDDLFNDFLHDHEEEVPAFIWTNLEGELKAKKRLQILYYLKAVAASIALFITFTLGYYVSDLHIISDNALNFKEDSLKLFSFITNENSDSINSELQNDFLEGSSNQKKVQKQTKKAGQSFNIASYKRIKIYEKDQLYRRYQFIKNIFSSDKSEKRSIILRSLNEKKSNQLLTDTLLLEKENLPEGGFLLTEKKNKASAWSFGTKFSPVISVSDNAAKESASLNGRDIKAELKSDKPKLNSEEKPLTSYTGGINVNYKVSKRLSVESGLYYSQRKQGTDNLVGSQNKGFSGDNLTVYTPVGTQSVNAINRSVLQNSFSTTYYMLNASFISNAEYIELPLIIRYKLIDQKIGLDVLSGVSSNFLVNNSSYILSGDKTLWSGNNNDLNSILYGATVGLGVNYNFYQNFSFNLEPTFKYTILSENSVFGKYPYSFAVFAGFSYHFK